MGPYLLFRTMVPDWPVVRSETLTCHPSASETSKKWIFMVSPPFMTRGFLLDPFKGSALKAAFSLLPVVVTCHAGAHTANRFGAPATGKPPSDERPVPARTGATCTPTAASTTRA